MLTNNDPIWPDLNHSPVCPWEFLEICHQRMSAKLCLVSNWADTGDPVVRLKLRKTQG